MAPGLLLRPPRLVVETPPSATSMEENWFEGGDRWGQDKTKRRRKSFTLKVAVPSKSRYIAPPLPFPYPSRCVRHGRQGSAHEVEKEEGSKRGSLGDTTFIFIWFASQYVGVDAAL